jgi:TrpR-related protein YerC/YecD
MTSGKVRPAAQADAQRQETLIAALTAIRSDEHMAAFLRDLCTTAELDAMAQRLQVASLVDEQVPYAEIARRTGASTATVTRVAYWLRNGTGGYRRVLERLAS